MSTFNKISEFGLELMSIKDIDDALEVIGIKAKSLINVERCSVFIVDAEDNMLWTRLSDGIGRIVISLNSGIVGETYRTKEPQIVNNPYEHDKFLQSIDKKSGYKTKNILTVPVFDSKHNVMGIIQLLNKSRFEFDEKDLETLSFFANYVSGSLELFIMNEKY